MSENRTRLSSCNAAPMPRVVKIQIGPAVEPRKVQPLPTQEDALYKARRNIDHLRHEISRLTSKIRRLTEDLEYEIAGWKAALDTGQRQESMEAIKRRISRLRGAIEFPGVIDYDSPDKNDMEER